MPGTPGGLVAAVYTLGCKLNQLESESISHAFGKEGFKVISWDDERALDWDYCLCIINTCTVTSKSEQKARRLIRKVLRDFPHALIIITGCYAQMEKEALGTLDLANPKRLIVIPGGQKNRILELPRFLSTLNLSSITLHELSSLLVSWAEGENSLVKDNTFCFSPGEFTFHSRAFLKIQDGCDNQCSYCRVRLARGKSRSIAPEEALRTLRSLEE